MVHILLEPVCCKKQQKKFLTKTGAAIKFFWLLLFCDSFNVYLINISLFVYYRSPGWKQSDIWNPTCSSIWPKLQLRLLTELKPPRARKWRNCKGSDAVAEKNPIVMLKMRLDFFFTKKKILSITLRSLTLLLKNIFF